MMNGKHHQDRALDFLRVSHLFRLGDLTTEQPHPETRGLSAWARHDLGRAVSALKRVDLRALEALKTHSAELDRLSRAIHETLAAGRRVYLCGCGATGRLSLSLEYLWRRLHDGDDRVRSFMAGGDVALVHSLEGFEDYPAYGARHLEQAGFTNGDLLIACTEGGETPFVIGATERAAEISSNPPFFLYCNADSALTGRVERFRRVYRNHKIRRICMNVGPMALTGSTRMQASTVLQLAAGSALLQPRSRARDLTSDYCRLVRETDFSFLVPFIREEAAIYADGNLVNYSVLGFGITVLTDTTERAPTFSLVPFDQLEEQRSEHSLCYVSLADAATPEDAWFRLLGREPSALNWPDVDRRTTPEYLSGFDFSAAALGKRRRQIPERGHHEFRVRETGDGIAFRLERLAHDLPLAGWPPLVRHLMLKQLLNVHSTLVMGRLGRYQNNLMTWVSPTNGKLVDRATRYVEQLLTEAGRTGHGYDEIVRRLFAEMEQARPGESVVLRTYRSLL